MDRRLLVCEELDPNGPRPYRWITPGIERLGWTAVALPTLAAVHLMGPDAYRSLVIRCVKELRPHVVLVNPPLDFLDFASCDRIRELGVQIIAWVDNLFQFDDQFYHAEVREDLKRRFDRCISPLISFDVFGDEVMTVPWVVAPESVAIDDPNAPIHEVVMVAPFTPERGMLARTIAEHGVAIACYGQGWALGPVTRPSRLALYRRARAVIIVDGQGLELVEAAYVGAKLIIERVPSLMQYLTATTSLASFSSASECAQLLVRGTQPRWTDPPTWDTVWPAICDGLVFSDLPKNTGSPSLGQFYASLAHSYELVGNFLAAYATFEAWAKLESDAYGPPFGLARCASKMKQFGKAAEQAELALIRLMPTVPFSRGRVGVDEGLGCGFGLSKALDPRVEMWAVRLWSLRHSESLHIALSEVEELDPMVARALRATMPLDLADVDDRALYQALTRIQEG